MFSLMKNVLKTLFGVRVSPQELAENVVREQIRLRGIDPASIPETAIHDIAEDGLSNGKTPTEVIVRIRAAIARIAQDMSKPQSNVP